MSHATPYQRKLIDETFQHFLADWREIIDGRKPVDWRAIIASSRLSLDDLERACSALEKEFAGSNPRPPAPPPLTGMETVVRGGARGRASRRSAEPNAAAGDST